MSFATFTGLPAAIALFLCWGLVSYRAAVWTLPSAGVTVRFCAAAVIGWWLLEVVFYVLAFSRHFGLTVALVVWLIPAAVVALRWSRADFAADRRALCAGAGELVRGSARIPLLVVTGILSLYVARGLVSPPIAWDALTYHLVHAARWIQHGALTPQSAPDAWGYYEYFPYAGEVLWAWAMLPLHGDALLAPASGAIVVLVGLSAFASARALHVGRDRSLLVALSIVATPAVLAFTGSAYVDTTALAAFGLGVLFLIRAARARAQADGALAAMAFGLYAAMKPSGLPVFAAALVLLGWSSLRRRRGFWAGGRRCAIIALVAAAPLCLQAIPVWLRTGSPFYPLAVDLFGVRILAGNRQLTTLLSGTMPAVAGRANSIEAFFRELFLSGQKDLIPHLNFGPSGLFLLAFGLPGLLRLCMRRCERIPGMFLLFVTALTAVTISLPNVAALRGVWAPVSGRLLTPALFSVAIGAGPLFGGRLVDALWGVAVLVSAWYSRPRGVSWPEAVAAVLFIGVAAMLVIVVQLVRRRWPGMSRPVPALVCVLLAAAPLGAVLHGARDRVRDGVYAAAARTDSFVVHPLDPRYASAWPIWSWLDRSPAQRIAVVAGWNGIGHNAYLYPLFGSHLQHEVSYVSPACSGEIIDYELDQSVRAAADFECWMRALIDARIDVVVALAPRNTPEADWLSENPEIFRLAASGSRNLSLAFRFDASAARAALTVAAPSRPRSPDYGTTGASPR